MPDPIRFGVLGCGRIVERGFLPGISSTPDAVCQAIASSRTGIAGEWAERHGVPLAFDSYEALLSDSTVDAVYVPSTGETHRQWTLAAAAAGKHVLCEKPLARTVAEAEEMVSACTNAGVLLQEAFMWRHHPRALQTRDLIASGAISALRTVLVSFSFDLDRNDWRLRSEKGGGAVWDLGCYGVNCARYVTGSDPIDVFARGHWAETGVDLSMQISLRFPGDVLAGIDCSFEAPFRCRAEFVGDGGRIVLENAFQNREGCEIQIQRSAVRDTPMETIAVPTVNQYGCQIAAFCASIRAGRLLPPAEDGLSNMRVMERILASATGARSQA